jgi:glycosyltransferase involved in cell wall biosynthesis
MTAMKCSVCIPTYNAGPYIGRLFSSLMKQTIPREVSVTDSSSVDNTIKIAESYGAKTLA